MVKKLYRRRDVSSGGKAQCEETHVGSIVESVPDGCIEELGKMSDSETTISGAGWRHAGLDFLENRCCIGFRNQRSTMAIIPGSFLRELREGVCNRGRKTHLVIAEHLGGDEWDM